MVKARSRVATRKMKDRWKAKSWYKILAPSLFDRKPIADTLAGDPDKLIGRVTKVSLQDLTGDFRKSHIKLFFKIKEVKGTDAFTRFGGHVLTTDYIRRSVRRRKSRIDGVYDVSTKDGALIRVKPFATTDKRIQNSQKQAVRKSMKKTVVSEGKKKIFTVLIKEIIDGKLGKIIYQNCKSAYPVRRVEIYRSEVLRLPSVSEKESEKSAKPKKKKKEDKEEKKESKGKEKEEKTKAKKKTTKKKAKKTAKKANSKGTKKKSTSKKKPKSSSKEKKKTKGKKTSKKSSKTKKSKSKTKKKSS